MKKYREGNTYENISMCILRRMVSSFGYMLAHQRMVCIRQCQMLCKNITVGVCKIFYLRNKKLVKC